MLRSLFLLIFVHLFLSGCANQPAMSNQPVASKQQGAPYSLEAIDYAYRQGDHQ